MVCTLNKKDAKHYDLYIQQYGNNNEKVQYRGKYIIDWMCFSDSRFTSHNIVQVVHCVERKFKRKLQELVLNLS